MLTNKRNLSILGLCDSVLHMVASLRGEYLRQTASPRERLCGEWVRETGNVSFRIYEKEGSFFIEERYGNRINDRVKCFTSELLEDEKGNLYSQYPERAFGFDGERDLLRTESFGDFQRKKAKNENEK